MGTGKNALYLQNFALRGDIAENCNSLSYHPFQLQVIVQRMSLILLIQYLKPQQLFVTLNMSEKP